MESVEVFYLSTSLYDRPIGCLYNSAKILTLEAVKDYAKKVFPRLKIKSLNVYWKGENGTKFLIPDDTVLNSMIHSWVCDKGGKTERAIFDKKQGEMVPGPTFILEERTEVKMFSLVRSSSDLAVFRTSSSGLASLALSIYRKLRNPHILFPVTTIYDMTGSYSLHNSDKEKVIHGQKFY